MTRGFFQRRANIIYYHGVWEADSRRRALFGGLDLPGFCGEIERLAKTFDFVSLDELLVRGSNSPGRPTLTLTFDDGFDLLSSYAAEFLESRGIVATAFVNTASVEYERVMWTHAFAAIRSQVGVHKFVEAFNRLQTSIDQPELNRPEELSSRLRAWPMNRKDEYVAELWADCRMPPMDDFLGTYQPYMGWADLKEWMSRGHKIGFHSHTHPYFSRLSPRDFETEAVMPLALFEKHLGLEQPPFAYPFGDQPSLLQRDAPWARPFRCLLGTGDLSLNGSSPAELSRVDGEGNIAREVFGRPVLRAGLGMFQRRAVVSQRSAPVSTAH